MLPLGCCHSPGQSFSRGRQNGSGRAATEALERHIHFLTLRTAGSGDLLPAAPWVPCSPSSLLAAAALAPAAVAEQRGCESHLDTQQPPVSGTDLQ